MSGVSTRMIDDSAVVTLAPVYRIKIDTYRPKADQRLFYCNETGTLSGFNSKVLVKITPMDSQAIFMRITHR